MVGPWAVARIALKLWNQAHRSLISYHGTRVACASTQWAAWLATCMSNHDGDYVMVDATHDGSAEKPLVMFGGKNPQTPPCFQGKQMPGGMIVMGGKGGAPTSAIMER